MVSLYLVKEDEKSYKSQVGGRKSVDDRQYLDTQNVLFKTRRSALMPYEDPILSVVKRVLFMGYYILLPRTQARTLTIPLAERVNFDKSALQPTAAFVEIEAGQDIQIYSTALTLTAQLRGLRWLMFHYRLITYMAFTFLFWVCEVLFMCVAWAIWSVTTTKQKNVNTKADDFTDGEESEVKDEYDEDSEGTAQPAAFGRHAAIKAEARVKREEEDDELQRRLSAIPVAGAEADDEDDFEDEDNVVGGTKIDSGTGTSYRSEGSQSVRQRPSHSIPE
jgi:hypothetical protein